MQLFKQNLFLLFLPLLLPYPHLSIIFYVFVLRVSFCTHTPTSAFLTLLVPLDYLDPVAQGLVMTQQLSAHWLLFQRT